MLPPKERKKWPNYPRRQPRHGDHHAFTRAFQEERAAVFETVDMNTVVQEVIALISNKLQRCGVTLRMELDDDLPMATGDQVQLQQVILNFILNATDAMQQVGEGEKALTIFTAREGAEHIRVAVKDVGLAFDPAMLEKLFNPFYTTKNDGMGIGLSVSRTIIENHHSRLGAELNDDAGATFWFSVPYGSEDQRSGANFGRMDAAELAFSKRKA